MNEKYEMTKTNKITRRGKLFYYKIIVLDFHFYILFRLIQNLIIGAFILKDLNQKYYIF